MMIYPPFDKLSEKCGDKYALAVLTSKRAKELSQGQKPLIPVEENEKIVSIASKEIYANKVFPIFSDEE